MDICGTRDVIATVYCIIIPQPEPESAKPVELKTSPPGTSRLTDDDREEQEDNISEINVNQSRKIKITVYQSG